MQFCLQKFKQKGREEQCEPDDPDRAEIVGSLLGCDPEAMMKAYCKPKIKVGTEWVTKGQVGDSFQFKICRIRINDMQKITYLYI